MGRTYERLDIKAFGQHLLETNDLDPIYVALVRCIREYGWSDPQVGRWLVAYWCFYHAGVACWMADLPVGIFWKWMLIAANNAVDIPSPIGGNEVNGGWPRAHERRHFRGQAAVRSVMCLKDRYPNHPEFMVDKVSAAWVQTPESEQRPLAVGDVMKRVQEHYLFGPWIGFKVADMLDRVLGIPISFDQGHMFMFADPVKAALMLWRQHNRLPEGAKPRDQKHVLGLVVSNLSAMFMTYKAPPLYDRAVGFQEIETILCKWKSHMNGHYPPWNDIDEILKGLDPWKSESEAAAAFAVAMPQLVAIYDCDGNTLHSPQHEDRHGTPTDEETK